jgi:hypothetical protein
MNNNFCCGKSSLDQVWAETKELAIKLKDEENPLVLTMFFYFDNMDFTGMGGEI